MKSILGRYDAAAELDADVAALDVLPGAPEPTATHIAVADLINYMIEWGRSLSGQPSAEAADDMQARVLLTVLNKARPWLLARLARMPAEEITAGLAELRAAITRVIDTAPVASPAEVENDGDGDGDGGTDRSDIAS